MSGHDGTTDATRQEQPAPPPVLRIVKGDPTPEEVAALVSVLSARAAAAAAAGAEPPAPRRSEWAGHERRLRRAVHPSPNGWRASAFPR